MNGMSRRNALRVASAIGTMGLLPGTIRYALAQQKPLRIPAILPISGPIAVIGKAASIGAQIAGDLANRNGGVLGRQVQVDLYDDHGVVNDSIANLHEVAGNGSNLVTGVILAANTLAALPVIKDLNLMLVTGGGATMALGHELYTPFLFHSLDNDYTRTNGLARLCAERYPNVKNWCGACTDSATYVQSYNNFRILAGKAYAAKGLKPNFLDPIVGKLGTTDFRTQLSQLESSEVDGIYNFVIGNDTITFWSQAHSFPFVKRLKVVADQNIDSTIARAMKKNLPPNLFTQVTWYGGLHDQQPYSHAFVEEYKKRTGDNFPPGWMQHGATPVSAVIAAVKATGGSTDTETVIRALEGLKFETVRGEVYFRKEDHNLITTLDFCNFVPIDEEPGFKAINPAHIPSSEVIEAPSPGKKFEI